MTGQTAAHPPAQPPPDKRDGIPAGCGQAVHDFVDGPLPSVAAVQEQRAGIPTPDELPRQVGMRLAQQHGIVRFRRTARGHHPPHRPRQFKPVVQVAVPDPPPEILPPEFIHLAADFPQRGNALKNRARRPGIRIAGIVRSDEESHVRPLR